MSDESQPPALRLKPRAQPAAETSPGQAQDTPQAPLAESNTPESASAAGDTPLKLKLKPRSAAAEGQTPAPVPPAAPEAPAQTGNANDRIRLKPKLAQTPDTQPESTAATPLPEETKTPESESQAAVIPAPPTPEPPLTIPPTPIAPSAGGAEPGNKFRLKSKIGGGDSNAPILFSAPATNPAPETVAEPAPQPEAPAAPLAPMEAPKPKVPHIRAPLGKAPEASDPTEKATQERQKKSLRLLIMIGGTVLALALLVGAFLLWQLFSEPDAPPPLQRPNKAAPAKATPAAPTTPKTEPAAVAPQTKPAPQTEAPKREQPAISNIIPMTMPVASLKEPIDKTKEVIASVRENEQKRVDELLDTPQSAAKPAAGSAPGPNTEPAPVATKPTPSPQPPLEQSQPKPAAAPAPSAAFKRFVNDCTINGVFQGARPKALINGRTFSAGDLVDKPLGIIFDKVDAETHLITFRDASGATVTRKY